jgi:hypothetical protein
MTADWNDPGSMDTFCLLYEHRRKCMSNQRYTPEFKDEAVRQVVNQCQSTQSRSVQCAATAMKCAGLLLNGHP